MSTSMAAALAASIPAPSSIATPATPSLEAIPASMSKVIDVEAEILITTIQLDGLVVTKIAKHSREAPSSIAHGLLIGLDLDGTLEVSNAFPLPHHAHDDDEKSAKSGARYQASMLRSLKEVQSDDSVVGFYQATSLGSFFNQSLVETQAIHQNKLRHGGIVVVHDITQASRGNSSFRAFRLTSSFLDAWRKANFNTASLISHRLTFSSIVEEVPLKIRANPLLSSFLDVLATPSTSKSVDMSPEDGPSAALPPNYASLDLGANNHSRNLERIVDAVDHYRTEEGNVAYLSRQIGREKAKVEQHLAKRREENAVRVSQGLAPLPEEDVSRMYKIPPEPSRLESMLLLGQVDAYAQGLEVSASTGLVKMYAAKASAAV